MPIPGMHLIQRKFRRTVNGEVPGLPEFSHIGFDIFHRVGGLGKHTHEGLFEICLIMRGKVTWWAKKETYDLRGGDIYFTWPDEEHGGLHDIMHPCTLYWIVLRIPKPQNARARNFLNLPPMEAVALCRAVHALPSRHLRGAELLEPYYRAVFEQLMSNNPMAVTLVRSALVSLLGTLVGCPPAQDKQAQGFVPPGIARAREFLEGCPRPWPKIGELATLAGMSASHFHARFAKEVGQAPMEFAHKVRLERARRDLTGGMTVTEVSQQLGYCSSQHLAACFKRYLGLTPTEAAQSGPH